MEKHPGLMLLRNERLLAGIGMEDGSVRLLRDLRTGIDYIANAASAEPFRLETDAGFSSEFESFECRRDDPAPGEARISLTWRTRSDVAVHGWVSLAQGADSLEFGCSADNGSEERLLSLEYPIIPNLKEITEGGEDDYVAHAFATGLKVRNPLKHFVHGETGWRYAPYPESFSGASMQFFAYYGMNKGGLYFAALDGEGYAKWLNFYKNAEGFLEASFIHGCEEMGAGKGIYPVYPVRISLLEGRDWHEAADLYKAWATGQQWCARGTLAQRRRSGDTAAWLHDEIGAATFGINAGSDRTPWLRKYRELIPTPIFHVLGPDWTNEPQTFYRGFPGGFDDWFPTRFHAGNLACLREMGDKFAPFEFDYLYRFDGADGELGKTAAQKLPDRIKSVDAYAFPFLCPAHPYTHDFHVRRDETLQRTDDVDAIYYDISANNILKVCMDETHGHPVGAGKAIEEAYRRNYADTKAAMEAVAGRRVPMGTEMMNETLLGVIDYYQARAGGQPAAPLEGWPLRELLKTGVAELIPMFAYVYHEYGAVRLDGWGKLVEEIGSLYYFTVARTYLWGGLYELNYEYSPMEALDGAENAAEEHYYPFEARGYAFSEERARYLAMYTRLRTGPANKYWAYGTMLKPLEFSGPRLRMDWFHYNHGTKSKEYNDSGELDTDAIVHSAWRYEEESVGLFFANVGKEGLILRVLIEPEKYGMSGMAAWGYGQDAHGPEAIPIARPPFGETEFNVPAGSVVVIELTI